MSEVKIDKLTPEQEAQTTVYRDKWIRIWLDTRPCDRAKVESLVPSIYETRGFEAPKTIHWADSPYAAIELVHEKYGFNKSDIMYNFCYGNHDCYWLGFYEYWNDVVGLTEECAEVMPLIQFSKECGWFLPYDEMICLVDRPEEINLLDEDGVHHTIKNEIPDEAILRGTAHKDGGMALRYRDGKGVYMLNGVIVDEYLATTSEEKIDASKLLKVKNAEVRREFVRKVGIEKVIEQCGAKTIDKQGDYELLLFDIGEGDLRPYLKMTNPSIGTYHVEGVSPECQTVDDALNFRNQTDIRPRKLT